MGGHRLPDGFFYDGVIEVEPAVVSEGVTTLAAVPVAQVSEMATAEVLPGVVATLACAVDE